MRKWILCAACFLLLCACAANEEAITVLQVWEPSETAESAAVNAPSIRIGMITDQGGIRDESFNQGAWEGLQALAQSAGAAVSYIEPSSDEEIPADFDQMAEDGIDLCWGIGYSFSETLLDAARRWPEMSFAIVDSSYDDIPENVTGVLFRAQEPSFLVGFIAAAVTQTGRIGFVGGMAGAEMDAFQYGYEAGAAYGAARYGKEVSCRVVYAETYTDPSVGNQLALKLYADGCDIIYHAAGSTGTGVIEAAVSVGAFAIGVDRDQAYLAPDHVLTSALKKVGAAVERVSRDYLNHRDVGGKTFEFGLAEGAVGIPEGHKNYSDEVYDAVLRVQDEIIAGTLVPPASQSAYESFLSDLAQ